MVVNQCLECTTGCYSFLASGNLCRLLITFCKQLGPRSGPTICRARFGSKLYDTLIVFVKEIFEKFHFEKNQMTTKAWKITQHARATRWKSIVKTVKPLRTTQVVVPMSSFMLLKSNRIICQYYELLFHFSTDQNEIRYKSP